MDSILIIQRVLGLILAILLFYSAIRLIKVLKNKEIALSMVFLHKQRITNLFGLLVIAALFTFLTGLVFVFLGNGIIPEILVNLNVLVLLIFTFSLQKLMRGDENKWT
jgi:hypothetical protein